MPTLAIKLLVIMVFHNVTVHAGTTELHITFLSVLHTRIYLAYQIMRGDTVVSTYNTIGRDSLGHGQLSLCRGIQSPVLHEILATIGSTWGSTGLQLTLRLHIKRNTRAINMINGGGICHTDYIQADRLALSWLRYVT